MNDNCVTQRPVQHIFPFPRSSSRWPVHLYLNCLKWLSSDLPWLELNQTELQNQWKQTVVQVSSRRVHRRLNDLRCRSTVAKKIPVLTDSMKKNRLEFARKQINCSASAAAGRSVLTAYYLLMNKKFLQFFFDSLLGQLTETL